MLNLNEKNCIFSYMEKMITEIISKHDKEMESVYLDDVNDISMLLLQTINQQINELGWK